MLNDFVLVFLGNGRVKFTVEHEFEVSICFLARSSDFLFLCFLLSLILLLFILYLLLFLVFLILLFVLLFFVVHLHLHFTHPRSAIPNVSWTLLFPLVFLLIIFAFVQTFLLLFPSSPFYSLPSLSSFSFFPAPIRPCLSPHYSFVPVLLFPLPPLIVLVLLIHPLLQFLLLHFLLLT